MHIKKRILKNSSLIWMHLMTLMNCSLKDDLVRSPVGLQIKDVPGGALVDPPASLASLIIDVWTPHSTEQTPWKAVCSHASAVLLKTSVKSFILKIEDFTGGSHENKELRFTCGGARLVSWHPLFFWDWPSDKYLDVFFYIFTRETISRSHWKHEMDQGDYWRPINVWK